MILDSGTFIWNISLILNVTPLGSDHPNYHFAPENRPENPKGNSSAPRIYVQVPFVSVREGTLLDFKMFPSSKGDMTFYRVALYVKKCVELGRAGGTKRNLFGKKTHPNKKKNTEILLGLFFMCENLMEYCSFIATYFVGSKNVGWSHRSWKSQLAPMNFILPRNQPNCRRSGGPDLF